MPDPHPVRKAAVASSPPAKPNRTPMVIAVVGVVVASLVLGAFVYAIWPDGSDAKAAAHTQAAAGNAADPWDGGEFGINVVRMADAGCSPDYWTAADPILRIRLDGKPLATIQSDQDGRPEVARFFPASPRPNSVVTVTMAESEPFSEIPCDVSAGPGTEAAIAWDGSFLHVVLRGDDAKASTVELVLGLAPPGVEDLRSIVQADQVRLEWSTPQPPAERIRVFAGAYGPQKHSLAGTATSATVTGLCDGLQYRMRVIVDRAPWAIGTDIEFTTPNLPPEPPRILSARQQGRSLSLSWEEPTAHDIERYDIHVGAAGFVPSDSNRIAQHKPFSDWRNQDTTVTYSDSATEVRIVAVDKGGLSASSAGFRIGSADQPGTLKFGNSCGK
jgi:hypothetical protein